MNRIGVPSTRSAVIAGALALILRHRHNDAIEQLRRPLDHIQMAVGERIKTAGVDHRSHESDCIKITLE